MDYIVQIGIHLIMALQDKYGMFFPNEVINTNIKRLTNQLWKLIPMRENQEDWNK
jgi:hypothetical protein